MDKPEQMPTARSVGTLIMHIANRVSIRVVPETITVFPADISM